jgi:hypothetical protein
MDDAVSVGRDGLVVELRRYTLHRGARETLVDLFDRLFIETQEASGMQVLGQFRDIDDPDAFVWLRGFPDMDQRARALADFYAGPVWLKHGDAARETMVNSDNVLLLRLLQGAMRESAARAAPDTDPGASGVFVCTTCHLKPGGDDEFASFFASAVRPELERWSAVEVVATFRSEHSPNTFPRLPVREGETVFVWIVRHRDLAAYAAHADRMARSEGWTKDVQPGIRRRIWRRAHVARLAPTSRSALR